jgi:hypothetical protein
MTEEQYTNTRLKPSKITDYPWLYQDNLDIISENTGKWMLFYENAYMDENWAKAKKLYRKKVLDGVISMKCSTMFKNPRSADDSHGVIILYCNNSEEETKIMKYGQNIKILFDYKKDLFYKTDIQSLNGTKATGCKKNWTYRLKD